LKICGDILDVGTNRRIGTINGLHVGNGKIRKRTNEKESTGGVEKPLLVDERVKLEGKGAGSLQALHQLTKSGRREYGITGPLS